MFLARLSNEKRHLFLELELYISRIDGDFNNLEKNIIDAHCLEMHIDNNNYENDLTFDEVKNKLNLCTKKEKHIIFIEMIAVVLADNVYSKDEEMLIRELSELLDIEKSEVLNAFNIIKSLKKDYEEFSNFVNC